MCSDVKKPKILRTFCFKTCNCKNQKNYNLEHYVHVIWSIESIYKLISLVPLSVTQSLPFHVFLSLELFSNKCYNTLMQVFYNRVASPIAMLFFPRLYHLWLYCSCQVVSPVAVLSLTGCIILFQGSTAKKADSLVAMLFLPGCIPCGCVVLDRLYHPQICSWCFTPYW